jgi:hypothetical protein
MQSAMLNKTHFNGYDVINVNNGPWRVCTDHDRLATFDTREEAMAFAASLPAHQERTATRAQGEVVQMKAPAQKKSASKAKAKK